MYSFTKNSDNEDKSEDLEKIIKMDPVKMLTQEEQDTLKHIEERIEEKLALFAEDDQQEPSSFFIRLGI